MYLLEPDRIRRKMRAELRPIAGHGRRIVLRTGAQVETCVGAGAEAPIARGYERMNVGWYFPLRSYPVSRHCAVRRVVVRYLRGEVPSIAVVFQAVGVLVLILRRAKLDVETGERLRVNLYCEGDRLGHR